MTLRTSIQGRIGCTPATTSIAYGARVAIIAAQIRLSRRLSNGGLDLTSVPGRTALNKRILDTAKEACRQLSTVYPLEQSITDKDACVAEAASAATARPNAILADSTK